MNIKGFIICLCLLFYLNMGGGRLLNAQENVEDLVAFVDDLITSGDKKDQIINDLIDFAQEDIVQEDVNNLIIFVDNEEQIPLERSLRIEYFKVLVEYNRMLFDGFLDTLRLMYGNDDYAYGHPARIATEGIKTIFLVLVEVIANTGDTIIMQNAYSREELYVYSRMSERFTEVFNELFAM